MPQVKKRTSRPRVTRSARTRNSSTAIATHTVSSTKLAISTLFLGFSALAAAAAGSLPSAADQARIDARMAQIKAQTTSTVGVVTSTPNKNSHVALKIKQGYNLYPKTDRLTAPSKFGYYKDYVGEWEVTAMGKSISLRKISFAIKTYAGPLDITDFGEFKLGIEGVPSGYTEVNATLNPNSNIVTFILPQPITIPAFGSTASSTARLALSTKINGSGILSPAAIRAFEIAPDTSENIEALDLETGEMLPPSKIWVGTDTMAAADKPLTNGALLLHDVYPSISKFFGTKLDLSANAQIFKFSVAANGTRDLTLEGINLRVNVNGLTGMGSDVGTISNFRLYTTNATGGIGDMIGQAHPMCLSGAKGAKTPAGKPCRFSTEDTVYFKGVNSSGAPFVIPAGSAVPFVLVADTTNIFAGKTSGSVSVAASILGETGLKMGNKGYETNWADGGLIYSYTPVNGTKVGPFSGSPSYPIYSDVIVRSL